MLPYTHRNLITGRRSLSQAKRMLLPLDDILLDHLRFLNNTHEIRIALLLPQTKFTLQSDYFLLRPVVRTKLFSHDLVKLDEIELTGFHLSG